MNDNLKLLIGFQELLAKRGFSIDSDGTYFKEYGLHDGTTARIIPHFDKGTSLDQQFKLVSISVSKGIVIPIIEGQTIPLELIPKDRECIDDVIDMIAQMAPQSRMPLVESYIVTAVCNKCQKTVTSFLQIKNDKTCLKCL